MEIKLIADSCCDLTPEMKAEMKVSSAPLRVKIADGKEYLDDGTVDIRALIADMSASRKGMTSACPSVEEYAALMRSAEACFVVTLSGKLSGSNNSANAAKKLVLEEFPEKKIEILDSESASAGETLLILYLHDKIKEGLSFEEIVPLARKKVEGMKTFFVLEDLSNLIKNGRMSKVPGFIASMLSLCPIMGEDGHGEIKLVAKARGIQNGLNKLAEIIGAQLSKASESSVRMTVAFCNCPERAESFKQQLLRQCKAIREVVVVPTGALSTMYASNGGVILAFQA